MADVIWLIGERGQASLRIEGEYAHLQFHPAGGETYLPLGDGFAAELHATTINEVGRVLVVKHRGDLSKVTIADLSSFAAPILPEPS